MFENLKSGDPMVIVYGHGNDPMPARVSVVRRNSDKSVRLVGIRPEGIDHVAWFAPVKNGPLQSVGGATVAYH